MYIGVDYMNLTDISSNLTGCNLDDADAAADIDKLLTGDQFSFLECLTNIVSTCFLFFFDFKTATNLLGSTSGHSSFRVCSINANVLD